MNSTIGSLPVSLDAVASFIPVAMLLVDADERVVYANPAAETLIGNKSGKSAGCRLDDFFFCKNGDETAGRCGYSPHCHACSLLKTIRSIIAGGGDEKVEGEALVERRFGLGALWIKFRARGLDSDGQRFVLISAEDIAERKQAEEALETEREQLLAMFNHMGEAIYVADPQTYELLYFNARARERWGDRLGEPCHRVLQNRATPCPFCTNDKIFGENTGKTYIWEIQNKVNERWYRCIDRAIRWPDGRMVRFEMAIDIDDSRRAYNNKVEGLSRMAGAVAHLFNNQLTAVIGNLELLEEDLPPVAGGLELLGEAMRAARRASETSGLMLAYLGEGKTQKKPVDLSILCRHRIDQLRTDLPENVLLKTDLTGPPLLVEADKVSLQQAVNALIANGVEALDGMPGKVSVSTGVVTAADIPKVRCFPPDCEIDANVCACLAVEDTGCGMDADTIGKIFDPFFTSKFTGRGLGLSVVLGTVRSYGGVVAVESEPGRGSKFRVFLPLSPDAVPGTETKRDAAKKALKCGGIVLLVEDQDLVRNMARTILNRLGFEVISAADGAEAVAIFRERAEDIRLVLTDLTMPRLNGWETLKALRKIRPDIPAILASGYDEASLMAEDHGEKPQVFLSKPYRRDELKAALEKALGDILPALDQNGRRSLGPGASP